MNLPKQIYALIVGLLWSFSVVAQTSVPKDTPVIAPPTLSLVERVQQVADLEAIKSKQKFIETLRKRNQENLLESVRMVTMRAGEYLKNRLDTAGITKDLNRTTDLFELAGDGIFTRTGSAQTYRNLTSSYKIIVELLTRANIHKTEVDHFYKTLVDYRYQIDSLNADTALYHFPNDSAELKRYARRYSFMVADMSHADSSIDIAIVGAQQLLASTNALVYKLEAALEEIERHQQFLAGRMLNREFSNLGGEIKYDRPINEVLSISRKKAQVGLKFYAADHWGKLLLLLVLIFTSTVFIRSLKQKLRQDGHLKDEMEGQLVFRYPFLASVVIVISIFQFIFPAPPFLFNIILWISAALSLAIIFKNFISAFWMKFWIIVLSFATLAFADNLILQASRAERWGMLILSFIAIVFGIFFLIKSKQRPLREKTIVYFIWILVIFETAAALTNIFGRYNLSKALLVSGYLNILAGILFLWSARLINETLQHAAEAYQSPQRGSFYLNFTRIGNKAPLWLYVLFVIGWFVLMARNFYFFRKIAEPFSHFFTDQRTVGNFTFNIADILLFFTIIVLSVLLSKIISFFASEPYKRSKPGDNDRKPGLGSWLLLVRVTIITSGLLIALAASGFPMDRITIILGALGVGIGLGLQGIVNNLVSGILIAFEKPVNVGDVIEFGGKEGTMKSIGFRSSVVTTFEGSDMIIPNGDLLSAHLINWSLGGNKRRFEIVVGVAYQTNLLTTKQLLEAALKNDPRILPYPAAQVIFHEFAESAVNLKVLYWVRSLNEGLSLKSDLIMAIEKALTEHNIQIPYPQQDIRVRFEKDEKQGPEEFNK